MIEVNVQKPRRCEGQHNFESFEELFRWISENFKGRKDLAAEIIISLAERGSYTASTGTYSLECSYDKPLHDRAEDLARQIGFRKKSRGLGGGGGLNLEKVSEYIKVLEEARPQSI
ncbi:MAG: hypothetical protein HY671_14905 [Chloroflexi bacterium]|nr:hypothetical protein [Chloroflexota bacterium]